MFNLSSKKRIIPISITAIFSLFLLSGIAKATVVEQLTNDSFITKQYEGIQQTFLGSDLPASMTDLTFLLGIGQTSDDYYLAGNSFFQDTTTGAYWSPDTMNGLASGNHGVITENSIAFHWNTPISIDTSHNYRMFVGEGNAGYNISIGGSVANTYANGSASWGYTFRCTDPAFNTPCSNTGSPADLAFYFGEPLPSNVVSLLNPSNESSINDFDNFSGNATALEGSMISYYIYVGYGRTSGTDLVDYDSNDQTLWFGGTDAPYTITKSKLLDLGVWYARAFLYDQENNLLTSSGEISFTITGANTGSGGSDYEPPPTVECGTTDFVCKIGNWFATTIPAIGTYLFVPSATVLNKYQDIWPSISAKVPIGYFPLISSAVEDITTGTGAYTLPEIDFFSTIRTAVGVLLWVLFAFWLIKRISIMQV